MRVSIHIPTSLRSESGEKAELSVSAETVSGALAALRRDYPAVYRSVCDETGAVRRHIHLFVNSSLVRGPDGLATTLQTGDNLSIMTAVSGG